jgi:hypothetical protein
VLIGLAAAAAVLLLIVLAVVLVQRRQPGDAVDSFRRQIDALSPEARRTVVEQVQRIEADDDKIAEDGPGHTEPDEGGGEEHRDGA